MSYSKSKFENLQDKLGSVFGGGIIDNVQPNRISYKNSPYARNFRIFGNGIQIRPGFYQLGDDITQKTIGYYSSGESPSTGVLSDAECFLLAITNDIIVQSTTGFPDSGTFYIGNDLVTYISKDANTFYGCTGLSLHYDYGTPISATGPGAGTAPFGIGMYLRTSGDRIIVGYKSDDTHYLQSITTAGAVTAVSTGTNITTEARMNFVYANDGMYCMNGVDGLGLLSGTTYTVANVLVFRFGMFWNGSLWCAGTGANANKLYKSITDTPGTFTGGDSDQLTFPEPLTGICGSNTVVYIFGENTLSYMNSATIRDNAGVLAYSTMPLDTNGGLHNSSCVVAVGKHVYYLSKANKIKRIAPGTGPQGFDVIDLSHRLGRGIEKIMAGLEPNQSNAFCYYDQNNEIIKWHVRTIGSTYNDLVVIYSTMFDEFYVDTNKSFFGGIYSNLVSYTISQTEPKLYIDEAGQTDDDSPIQFEYDTKHIDMGAPYILKEIWQSRLFIAVNQLAVITQEIWADGALIDTYTIDSSDIPVDIDGIGTLEIGTFGIGQDGTPAENEYNLTIVREKGNLQVRAKYFQFKYKCSTLGAKCTLMNLLPRLEILSELIYPVN